MISKSRFKDYYAKWSSDEQKRLLEIMERLIRENSEYADNKNYGHMCNLITSLAMETVLEERGKTRSEAQDAVAQAMYSFIQPKIAPMQKLAGNSWFVGMLKLTMPHKIQSHRWLRLGRGISQMRERRFYYDNPQVHLPADIQQIRYARNDGDILQGGRYYVQRPAPCGVYLLRADRQGRKYVRLYF